jgi:hypothetical protein
LRQCCWYRLELRRESRIGESDSLVPGDGPPSFELCVLIVTREQAYGRNICFGVCNDWNRVLVSRVGSLNLRILFPPGLMLRPSFALDCHYTLYIAIVDS